MCPDVRKNAFKKQIAIKTGRVLESEGYYSISFRGIPAFSGERQPAREGLTNAHRWVKLGKVDVQNDPAERCICTETKPRRWKNPRWPARRRKGFGSSARLHCENSAPLGLPDKTDRQTRMRQNIFGCGGDSLCEERRGGTECKTSISMNPAV